MKRTDLAKAIDVSTAAITQTLGREDRPPTKASSTRLMFAIHEAIGWPPPADDDKAKEEGDPLRARLLSTWPYLDDTERQFLELIVERHKKKT
jgi:hypothetical protein